jgi:IgGFc binding protein
MPPQVIDHPRGDPSQTNVVAVEQYRLKYVFLAPTDYEVSYVDVVGPSDAIVTLDGSVISAPSTPIGASGFGIARVTLGSGNLGAHVLEATKPVGIQVMGYGEATSYYYPGGLNLELIAPPPPIIK